MNHIDLTIAIPTYNSIAKMVETIDSLRKTSELVNCEVIFVDDCSSDDTFERLSEIAVENPSWSVYRLEKNSGSAAGPRNYAIGKACGEWIYFLDSDDVLEPKGIEDALRTAKRYNYDAVRTSLRVRMGDGTERIGDLIPKWDSLKSANERIRAITRHQSLTCSFFAKRSILMDHHVRFDEKRRIGEDIKFTSEVLLHCNRIGYRALPSRTYVRNAVGAESVTQKINSEQFSDFTKSWNEVEENLSELGISFVAEHGFSAVQYALRQFVWFKSEELSKEAFDEFADFCNRHKASLCSFAFQPRYRELVDAALARDHAAFNQAVQLRVLVAGHDLKFMGSIENRIREHYPVRIDKWDGHTRHDERESKQLLAWADFVWVEWLLGAAVWYSKHLRGDQRMVVRAHRSEVTVDYGNQINLDRVSGIICIAPHVLGDIADKFDIPRSKLWLIPNALDVHAYERGDYDEDRLQRIAMVGIVPRLKGFKKALEVLASLKKDFPQVELHVYGKQPEELEWVLNKPEEARYYEECRAFIAERELENNVHYHGWVDPKQELCGNAAVISMSDFEGMQVSVAEGYCAGGIGMTLNWRGAEQGYPKQWVFDSSTELEKALRGVLKGEIDVKRESQKGRAIIEDLYSIDSVWPRIEEMMKAVRA